MKKQIIISFALISALMLGACNKQANGPEFNEQTTEITTIETTVAAQTTESTTEATTTQAPAPAPDKYVGTFTEFLGRQNNIVITSSGKNITIKFNMVNNSNAGSIPVGVYTAKFKYDDVKSAGNGTYTVKAKASGNGKSFDFSASFYGEEGKIDGASVTLGNSSFEMIEGKPVG